MSDVFYLALVESLHKRITYLKGENIIKLTEYTGNKKGSKHSFLNKASRQTISAFREKGVWKIGTDQ